MKSKLLQLGSPSLLALCALACGSDDSDGDSKSDTASLPANAGDAIANYAEIVYASYSDALSSAQALDAAVTSFVAAPSEAGIASARDAWRASREPYLQTEVYRFYDGPIDNPTDGPEGLLNAWPLDENYIDYVVSADGEADSSGMVNDPAVTIDKDALLDANEGIDEKSISTGYHAVEFLLWGQDLDPNGPGNRPFTDYVVGGTASNQERRARYLTTVSDLLVDNLQTLVAAWAPDTSRNFRADFVGDAPATSLGKLLSGMIILSGFETGGERLQAALDSHDQEDEHSCFSDNTDRDMVQDVQGMQNVWLGSYTGLDGATVSGTSVRDVIAAGDAALAGQITDRIATSLSLAKALQKPFDREIADGNTAGNARVQALVVSLFDQRVLLQRAFALYGLTRIPDPTP